MWRWSQWQAMSIVMESCDDENQITEGNFKLYLKEEHEGGVEGGESREETHCGAPEAEFVQIRPTVTLNSRKGRQFNVLMPVCQHIEHCAKLAALTQQPCSVPVHSVQETYIVIGSMN